MFRQNLILICLLMSSVLYRTHYFLLYHIILPSPILNSMFDADGFSPIITTARQSKKTKGGSAGEWKKSLAIAEKDNIRISQINFENRFATNPVAKLIFERLITG